MCGQYGVFGSGIIQEDINVFKMLMFINMLRGQDATGFARIWRDGKFEIKKDVKNGLDFCRDPQNKDMFSSMIPVALMGHNRSATVGASGDIRGAHPFETDKYIGFHNGTLVEDRFVNHKEFLTDSEAFWDEVTTNGLEETVKKLSVRSAFALSYYNKEAKKIGFVRNKLRPLWFACSQKRNVVWYSSDLDHLEFVLNEHGIKEEDFNVYTPSEFQSIECNPADFTFVKTDDGKRVNTWTIKQWKPEPVEEPTKVFTHYGRGHNNWNSRYEEDGYWDLRSSTVSYLKCKGCSMMLSDNTRINGKSAKPIWVRGHGHLCEECFDEYTNPTPIDNVEDNARALQH